MQILTLIVAAAPISALSYCLFHLGNFYRNQTKANEPVECGDAEEIEEELDNNNDIVDEYEEETLDDDYKIIEDDEENTDTVMTKRKGLRRNCVISQMEEYYDSYELAEFLVNSGAGFSPYKFKASCLLQCAIIYVRFFQDRDAQDFESLIEVLLEAKKYGVRRLQREIKCFGELEKTPEMQEIYEEMVSDFNYSSVADSENSEDIIELAISVLLPYVSGYTIVREGFKYSWKLTNTNKNIAAKAKQREWLRQMLLNLNCIEESIGQMQHQNMPCRMEDR